MKKYFGYIIVILVTVIFLFTNTPQVNAISRIRGYYKPSRGTYVMPHYRSSPNRSKFDNWSTKGNINPFTGKRGYKSPFKY